MIVPRKGVFQTQWIAHIEIEKIVKLKIQKTIANSRFYRNSDSVLFNSNIIIVIKFHFFLNCK